MGVKESVSELEESDKFQEWREENPENYLVHAFTMIQNGKDDWQFGYYSDEDDKVVVFEMGDEITQAPEEDILKKNRTVSELNLDKVDVDHEEAVDIAMEAKEESDPGERVTKKILILQNLEGKQIYNITLVTTAFNIINIKVSAEDGEIIKESKESIMNLSQSVDE